MTQTMVPNPIQDDIADTLFIPLYMKHDQTRRDASFFNDPAASGLVERIDYDFSRYECATRSAVGVCLRAKYFDALAAGFIAERPCPVVVNLGCGLDTRFQRLGPEVASRAVVYELDLPEVIAFRKKLIPESENNIYLAASLFETGWMDYFLSKHPLGDFLFIIEGVLMFFENQEVKGFLENLARRFPGNELAFDVTSSWMCKNSHRHDTLKHSKACFKMALDDDRELERWVSNLSIKEVRRYGDFSEWRRCGLLNYWAMRLIPALNNASRILHCEII
jgi:O-methyltransferase involved in polyketide biosynthesis